jgi:ABC-type branched-subunit amino acid transport system ATPase component
MTALAVRGLSKSFGGLRVTANVNLKVEPGDRRLIIGPNGAGKTTLFNLITGELALDAGSIHLFDRDITKTASRKRAHLGMARTYQIITLFTRDTILRNATLALLGLSPLRWNFMLGAIFVAIVVFMPEGLVPGAVRLSRSAWRAMSRPKAAARAAPAPAAERKP